MNINLNSSLPIYEQLYDQFVSYIQLGILEVDNKLPSVRELSSQVHVNPNTVQKVYRMLEENGFVYSIPGKGSFVCRVADSKIVVLENEMIKQLEEVVIKAKFINYPKDKLYEKIEKLWGNDYDRNK